MKNCGRNISREETTGTPRRRWEILVKVTVKSMCLTKYHAMKMYFRSEGMVPNTLNLDTKKMGGYYYNKS
jgi:hypothetical protein